MFASLITALRKWCEDRQAIEALARLSDERLTDLGLNRWTLRDTIRHGTRP